MQNGTTILGRNPIDVIRKSTYVGICASRFNKENIVFITNDTRLVIVSTIARSKPITQTPYLLSAMQDLEAKKSLSEIRTE